MSEDQSEEACATFSFWIIEVTPSQSAGTAPPRAFLFLRQFSSPASHERAPRDHVPGHYRGWGCLHDEGLSPCTDFKTIWFIFVFFCSVTCCCSIGITHSASALQPEPPLLRRALRRRHAPSFQPSLTLTPLVSLADSIKNTNCIAVT